MIQPQRRLCETNCPSADRARFLQIAFEPELKPEEVQSFDVIGVRRRRPTLDVDSAADNPSCAVVLPVPLERQTHGMERAPDARVHGTERGLSDLQTAIQRAQRAVVMPGFDQRGSEVVERIGDARGVGRASAFADPHRSLEHGDRAAVLASLDQDITEIQKGGHEISVRGPTVRFLVAQRLLGDLAGGEGPAFAVEDESLDEDVGGDGDRVITVKAPRQVDLSASRTLGLLVRTLFEQRSRVWRELLRPYRRRGRNQRHGKEH
jgi:hypothetical protein